MSPRKHPASPTRISRCASCGCRNQDANTKSMEFGLCDHCYQIKLLQGALANNTLSVEEYSAILGVGDRNAA
jgi:hypothetical protein